MYFIRVPPPLGLSLPFLEKEVAGIIVCYTSLFRVALF